METDITPQVLRQVEQNVLLLLSEKAESLFPNSTLASPRAVGDAVQEFLGNHLSQCFPADSISHFEDGFERRSMEDMAFYDRHKNYYAVDVKTHNLGTHFNMPNLISVRRLARFYENDTNTFLVLIIEYQLDNENLHYTGCHFHPIEHFQWECLTLGALGWGQLQIANANYLLFDTFQSRRQWMLNLCDNIQTFYDTEIGKITERRMWFDEIRAHWINHD